MRRVACRSKDVTQMYKFAWARPGQLTSTHKILRKLYLTTLLTWQLQNVQLKINPN